MTGKWLGLFLAAVAIVVGVAVWPNVRSMFVRENLAAPSESQGYGRARVTFSDSSLTASVPLTAELQAKGLGGRTHLGDGEGMIWLYERPGTYAFWMKDMLIPLDFVWIRNGRIVELTANVQPPQPGQSLMELPLFRPKQPVDAILEVRAGYISAHGLEVDEVVRIDRF